MIDLLPINHETQSELTTRGTIAVKTAGYLVGDRVFVRINGVNVGATVVLAEAFRVEVQPDGNLVRYFETGRPPPSEAEKVFPRCDHVNGCTPECTREQLLSIPGCLLTIR